MGKITFTLIDHSEKRVMPQLDASTLGKIVETLALVPKTIDDFEERYMASTANLLYDAGSQEYSQRLPALKQKTGKDTQAISTALTRLGFEDRDPNYAPYQPDEETPFDIPKPTDNTLGLCDRLKEFGIGILVVDLRNTSVSYFSQAFEIAKGQTPVVRGPRQYNLQEPWKVIRYSLELRASEQ